MILFDLIQNTFQLSLIHILTLLYELDMTAGARNLNAPFPFWNSDFLSAVRTAVYMIVPPVLCLLFDKVKLVNIRENDVYSLENVFSNRPLGVEVQSKSIQTGVGSTDINTVWELLKDD